MSGSTPEERLIKGVQEAFSEFRRRVGAPDPNARKRVMTPADHYAEAMRLLDMARDTDLPYGTGDRRSALREEAQVHATLACVSRAARGDGVMIDSVHVGGCNEQCSEDGHYLMSTETERP